MTTTTAANPPGKVSYIRGPWVLAFFLMETDALYGGMLSRLDDSQEGRKA